MNWIPTDNNTPPFGLKVRVIYPVYGESEGVYKQIFGTRFGFWYNEDNVIGNLKPTHWAFINE